MNKIVTVYLFSLLLFGCGGSARNVEPESPQNDVVSQTVEIMDLRSSVIILQSEIIELKETLKLARELNQNLHETIEEKSFRLSTLEDYQTSFKAPNLKTSSHSNLRVENVEVLYKTALAFYFESNYEESIKSFEHLINFDDSHDLSDNAQYWIGESYFGIGNYARALTAFEVVLTYPQSNKNDYAQLKIGLCLLKLKREPQAYAVFQSFINSYPKSELISRVIVLRDRIQ